MSDSEVHCQKEKRENMSDAEFYKEFERLVGKYAELLTGDKNEDVLRKVQVWSLFTHMNKTMPSLIQHWIKDNSEAGEQIKKIISEIKDLNKRHQEKQANQ